MDYFDISSNASLQELVSQMQPELWEEEQHCNVISTCVTTRVKIRSSVPPSKFLDSQDFGTRVASRVTETVTAFAFTTLK